MIHKLLVFAFILGISTISNAQETGTFTDHRDGKTYKTVKIGAQWFMAENLAFKPTNGNFWAYKNDSSNILAYGYLYDWGTSKNVAPIGWHLPSLDKMQLELQNLREEGYSPSMFLLFDYRLDDRVLVHQDSFKINPTYNSVGLINWLRQP